MVAMMTLSTWSTNVWISSNYRTHNATSGGLRSAYFWMSIAAHFPSNKYIYYNNPHNFAVCFFYALDWMGYNIYSLATWQHIHSMSAAF